MKLARIKCSKCGKVMPAGPKFTQHLRDKHEGESVQAIVVK